MTSDPGILVINCGSSSVKFAVFAAEASLGRRLSGEVERIGTSETRFRLVTESGDTTAEAAARLGDHRKAIAEVIRRVRAHTGEHGLRAVGHRVVHGGPDCDCPSLVTPEVEERLRGLVDLAPLHLPHNLAGIAAVREIEPDLPQVACFDTAFHHALPALARLTTLPRALRKAGIRRYGFHGLSYEYVVDALVLDGVDVAAERIIIAHLGNGASMCAVKQGHSVETTMGFSTVAGLMMGTRAGDVDPGLVLYIMRHENLAPDAMEKLLYEQSGLFGVSGIASDMRTILAHTDDPAAREAVELFCYVARRHLAALTASLGGLDRLVFTGGIGAHAPEIRARVCDGLAYLGVTLDESANRSSALRISPASATVTVQAMESDEETAIARHVWRRLRAGVPS